MCGSLLFGSHNGGYVVIMYNVSMVVTAFSDVISMCYALWEGGVCEIMYVALL